MTHYLLAPIEDVVESAKGMDKIDVALKAQTVSVTLGIAALGWGFASLTGFNMVNKATWSPNQGVIEGVSTTPDSAQQVMDALWFMTQLGFGAFFALLITGVAIEWRLSNAAD